MDLVSFSLVAVFCILGAVIAYGADNLGRYLGKRRHTLFGMRPRHTATLITMSAGFLLPALTVFLMWAVSNDVRVILAEGSRAASERDVATKELAERKKEVSDKTAEIVKLESQRSQVQAKLSTTTKDLEERRKEIATLKSQSDVLRAKIASYGRQIADTQKRLVELNSRFATLEDRFKFVNIRLREADGQQIQLLLENRRIEVEKARLEKLIATLETTTKELEARELNARNELAETDKLYRQLLTDFGNEKATKQQELETINLNADRLRGEIASLKTIRDGLAESVGNARTRPMIFQREEELVRFVVVAGADASTARSALTSVLRSARIEAANRGADPNLQDGAAGLMELRDTDGRIISVSEIEGAIISAVTGKPQPYVLIANALWNSFAGEYVPLRVQALPNPVVYGMGELISEARIDGNLSEDGILQQITKFLNEGVQTKLRRDGMIPALGRQEQFGTISSEEVLQLVKDIREARRIVRLQALALLETRAADPLRLVFRIR